LGTILVDHQVMLEALPSADTKGEILEDRHQVGGPVPTALCLLRRFGVGTRLHGRWGNDTFGRLLEADLVAEGIKFDARGCRTASRTGFAHVWVEQGTGRRTIAAYRGSHATQAHEAPLQALAHYRALHLDGWSTGAAVVAAKAMRAKGGVVFLDLGSPKHQLAQLLALVDFLTCPETLIPRLFGSCSRDEGARRLLSLGPREVAVTAGQEGAWLYAAGKVYRQPGFVVDARDTTGAGDVFAGGMIFGELSGWTARQKLVFACAAAALKCRTPGNRKALPALTDIGAFLDTNPVTR
jgi:ribokinase